jgi:hypothetical protein
MSRRRTRSRTTIAKVETAGRVRYFGRVMRATFLLIVFAMCGCNGAPIDKKSSKNSRFFTDQGMRTPDLWCRSFLDFDNSVTTVLYLWRGSNRDGYTLRIPRDRFVKADYSVSGASDRWGWDNYSVTVDSSGEAYFHDSSIGDSVKKGPDYKCCMYTGSIPVCPLRDSGSLMPESVSS